MKVKSVRLIARPINDQAHLIKIHHDNYAIKPNAPIIRPIRRPRAAKIGRLIVDVKR